MPTLKYNPNVFSSIMLKSMLIVMNIIMGKFGRSYNQIFGYVCEGLATVDRVMMISAKKAHSSSACPV